MTRQSARRARIVGGGIFALYYIAFCSGAFAQERVPWKVDAEEAGRLASEGWFGAEWQVDRFDPNPDDGGPFLVFYGVTPQWSNGSFGFFAVNRWTGDVFSLWDCRKLDTPALGRSQAKIRRRFTPDELKQYARLSHLKPEWPDCTFGD